MGKATRIKKNQMYSEYCTHQDCGRYQESLEQKIGELEYELSQTKEILKDVISSYNHDERFTFEKVLKRAEQFIKEIEK